MVRSFARTAFLWVAGVFTAGGIVQVFLAGLGVFDDLRTFATHREFGYLLSGLPIVMVVLALAGRMPRRFLAASALIFGLFILQSVFVAVRQDFPAIAALHPVNGFLIVGLGTVVTRAAWHERRAAGADRAEAAGPPVATSPGEAG